MPLSYMRTRPTDEDVRRQLHYRILAAEVLNDEVERRQEILWRMEQQHADDPLGAWREYLAAVADYREALIASRDAWERIAHFRATHHTYLTR